MAVTKKSLGEATPVHSILGTNSVMVEIGGSIRRITVDEFQQAINENNGELLQSIAWGVPIKQSVQTSPAWGRVGNLTMWEQYKAQAGRYLLRTDGAKAAKLSATDSTKYADGTAVNESVGNIMFHAPRLYYHVAETGDAGVPYLWMSQYPIGGHYIEAPWLGAFMGSIVDNKLRSISGKTPANNITINAFWSAAQQNGKDYGLINYDHVRLMEMLNLSQYGNANSQENIGYGCCGDGNTWDKTNGLLTGATASLGDSFGKIDISSVAGNSKACRVNLLGVEDFYGWYWQMIQGVFFGNSGNAAQIGSEVYVYEGNRMPTTAELATHPTGNYRQLVRATTEGWVKQMLVGEYFDLIPQVQGADANSCWCDNNWTNTTGQLLLWGGSAGNGSSGGVASSRSSAGWSHTTAYIGSRLAYYGEPQIVAGAAITA